MRNVRRVYTEPREEWNRQLPRYVTRARDVTGPVTRAPCAPGHVSCHALARLPPPYCSLPSRRTVRTDRVPTTVTTGPLSLWLLLLPALSRIFSIAGSTCLDFSLHAFSIYAVYYDIHVLFSVRDIDLRI